MRCHGTEHGCDERAIAKLPIAEMRRLARKLDRTVNELERADEQELSSHGTSRGWRWAIDARLAKRAKALGAAMADAGAVYLPERLHTVRIAMKKLRYTLEFSAEMSGARTTPELQVLKRVQDPSRTDARSAGVHRTRPPGPGIAAASRILAVARTRRARRRRREQLSSPARALRERPGRRSKRSASASSRNDRGSRDGQEPASAAV